MARALGLARIACFEMEAGKDGAWRWFGATFGITGVDGPEGRARLLEAVFDADRPSLWVLLSEEGAAAADNGLLSVEIRILTAHGGSLDLQCEVTAEPASPFGPATLIGTIRDVTHERRFEADLSELVRHNHLLLATIDACPLSITVSDMTRPDAPLIYANRRFLEITGYQADEVIGHNCRFLQGPGTDRTAVERIRGAIARGEQTELRLLNYTRAGEPFLNNLMLSPLRDEAGALSAYLGLQEDVTLEAARSEAEAQRQKMEALGRMMGGVAHEVNNMLQPIALLAQHLLDAGLAQGEAREHVEVVLDCSLKARQIIGDLLTFSRPATRLAQRHAAAALMQDALRLVRPALPAGIALVVQIRETLPDVAIERTVFAQIVLNLATNAAAAMQGSGRLSVTVEPMPSALPIEAPSLAGGLRIRVIDTGCGMDRVTLDRAFEPFFTTKPVGQGTGLGLPMVYGLVREAGGSITLQSQPGIGTAVTILLPPAPPEEMPAHGHHPGH
ncbi:PAS domain-containing protein [Roseomonas frigidaquae]|uniref:histidine kinase n=1 Tax=Falsiroseomonas frigidaquae TaxID=487318 RepID=A0ABX1F1U1_9PROT|nr:ATP-binding protein [Falsiroseomonas frigidaquae]NKE46307.1 PAS domain-containing protein [Falsiroseomonas frigidaquae]